MPTESHPLITKSRLEALSDGVIAIVMTILVLQLGDSELFDAASESELHAALVAQWPLFVSYALSFLVVGAYWVAHHTYFSFIHEVNETQLWLNLLFLFCLSFIPFSAELLGEHPRFRAGVMLYSLNMTASSTVLYWNWRYASRSGHIWIKDSDLRVVGTARSRTRRVVFAYLLTTGVAFFSPLAGFCFCVAVGVLSAVFQIGSKTMDRLLQRV